MHDSDIISTGSMDLSEFMQLKRQIAMAKASPSPEQLMKAMPALEQFYKGAEVGDLSGGVGLGGAFTGAFTPLMTQQIDAQWTSETFEDDDLVLQKILATKNVDGPLYFVTTMDQVGDDGVPAAFAEGGVTEEEVANFRRQAAEIKFMGVQRSVTDVAGVTEIITNRPMVSKSALEQETGLGIQSLAWKYERALVDGDSSMSPYEFDGIKKQIRANGNVTNADGGKLMLSDFIRQVFSLRGDPTYAKISHILADPTLVGCLVALYHEASNRTNVANLGGNVTLIMNAGQLAIVGPTGKPIPILPMPLIKHKTTPRVNDSGVAIASGKAPTVVAGGDITITSPAAPTPTDTNFKAADAGDYYFKVVAVGDKGSAAALTKGPITLSAGDRFYFDIDDADAPTSGDYSVRYYEVYRSAKDGSADTCEFVGRFARNILGTGLDSTGFYEENRTMTGTSPVIAIDARQESIFVAELLPPIRRALAELGTKKPFMVMRFSRPHVRARRKHYLWDNVSLTL